MNEVRQWTVKEIAERAGLTTARIRQLLIDGRELVGYKLGRDWFVDDRDVQKWLDGRGK